MSSTMCIGDSSGFSPDLIGIHDNPENKIHWFFRVKCGSETCYRQTRLPYEFKLIAIIPNMVLEAPILSSALSDEQKLNYA